MHHHVAANKTRNTPANQSFRLTPNLPYTKLSPYRSVSKMSARNWNVNPLEEVWSGRGVSPTQALSRGIVAMEEGDR
jgi:hypothetical protein